MDVETVERVLNRAADDVLDAANADDEGLRDAVNLLVNATMYRLAENPQATLADVVDNCYDVASLDEVVGWIKQGVR